MMTWEEITDLLIPFGEKVHVIRGDDADAVSLQLVPAGWFVSIKSSGVLNTGTYEGKENRLVEREPFLLPNSHRSFCWRKFRKQWPSKWPPFSILKPFATTSNQRSESAAGNSSS